MRALDSLQIDLAANMQLNSIVYEQDTLDYKRIFDAVIVRFRHPLKQGQQAVLRVNYEGKPLEARRPPWEGGFVWKKDKEGKPWAGVACERIGAHLWWPLKDHQSDEPDSAAINITVPKGLFCVCNGRLVQRVEKGADKEEFRWKVHYPVNTYNITFYLGDYEHFTLPYDSAGHELHFYVLKPHLEKAREHFKQAITILKTYEELFGPYAFADDDYKLVESPYAGMEHQTAIAYGNGYRNNYFGLDYIILHETAHEWWGNAISVADFADVWIHEGMATYSEALFIERTKGYAASLEYLRVYGIVVANKKPVVGPHDVNYWDYKDGDPYTKGAVMLHSLRTTINKDKVFFDILRTFYSRYKYRIANTADFIGLVNEKTGSDYNWFFRQYLYDRRSPAFTYRIDKRTSELHYRWTDTQADFVMPVSIFDGQQKIKLYPGAAEKTYKLNDPTMFRIDQYEAYFRVNKIK
jgi:aminopeptidase N